MSELIQKAGHDIQGRESEGNYQDGDTPIDLRRQAEQTDLRKKNPLKDDTMYSYYQFSMPRRMQEQ